MDLVASLLLLMLAHQLREASALKLLHLNVPAYISRGERAHLECSYDLESDRLYSVTWYKDNEEFYKYEIKSNIPNKTSYTVDGIKLNKDASDNHKVILENVSLETKGKYTCEVTADVQGFPSVRKEKHMQVYVAPEKNPRITGEEKIYANGDVLMMNCTSDKSYPAANLTWYINGVKVNPDGEATIQHDDLLSTVSSLRIELGPDHISAGRLTIRCESLVETSDRASEPKHLRITQILVQSSASATSPSNWLMALLLLHRIAILLR